MSWLAYDQYTHYLKYAYTTTTWDNVPYTPPEQCTKVQAGQITFLFPMPGKGCRLQHAHNSTLLSIPELPLDIFSMCTIYVLSMHGRLSTFSITVEKQRQLNLSWFTVSWKADYPSGKVGKKRQNIHMYAQHNLKLSSS